MATRDVNLQKKQRIIIIILAACVIALLLSHTVLIFGGSDDSTKVNQPEKLQIKMPPQVNYRLPTAIMPTHYDLLIHPNLTAGSFTGRETITIRVLKTTNAIVLHSKSLDVENVTVKDSKGVSLKVTKVDVDTSLREFLTVELESTLNIDENYELTLSFNGSLVDRIIGLYKSAYTNDKGEKRALATCKFEPTYARMAFPCFDEPHMKAEYTIHVVRPKETGYIALSNMPIEKESEHSETETLVTFRKSVPMSTYLVCVIVSDFVFTEKNIPIPAGESGKKDIQLRVYATPLQINKTQLALDTAYKIAQYYVDYFQIDYPLPKLDLAAIPDFSSGALETWGLVTFRETALLFDPERSSVANMERVITVVAHELAHMWFGNLVTMDWWNDLWLNEGFASYMQYKSVNHIHPEQEMLDEFVVSTLIRALNYDSKASSHPIVENVTNPDEITAIFDIITYSKGSSVIRMLEHFVGEKIFRNGITKYLNKHVYKNAITADLFDSLQTEIGDSLSISDVMDTWTRQMGLPVLNVTRKPNGEIVLTQKRFLIDPDVKVDSAKESPYGYKWTIPVTYVTNDNSSPVLLWFDKSMDNLTINTIAGNAKFVKFNHNFQGYYRVNYDQALWDQLIANYNQLNNLNKVNLIDDVFSLATAGQVSYHVALKLAENLATEINYAPLAVFESKLLTVTSLLYHTEVYPTFLKFAQNIILKIYRKITWVINDNNFIERKVRSTVLSLACHFEVKECLYEVSQRLNRWLGDPHKEYLHPDIKFVVYQYGMQHIGTEVHWDKMWNLFVNEQDAQEKNRLFRGLSSVKEPWLISKLLELSWNETYVRRQDWSSYLQLISRNRVGSSIVWDYVRNNWPKIIERFGLNDRYVGTLIPEITRTFTTELKLDEVKSFFEKYPEAGAGAAGRKQALENIQNSIKWLKYYKDDIKKYLYDNL